MPSQRPRPRVCKVKGTWRVEREGFLPQPCASWEAAMLVADYWCGRINLSKFDARVNQYVRRHGRLFTTTT